MSVCFHLTQSALNLDQWDQLIDQWSDKLELEFYRPHEFNRGDRESTAFLWGPGQIRGIVLFHDGSSGDVELRLSALASRRDWLLAFSLMKVALRRGGGGWTRETGETYTRETLTKEQALEEWKHDFGFSLTSQFQQLAEVEAAWLPMGDFNLPLRKADIPSGDPRTALATEKRLLQRAARFGEAYPASTMVMQGPQGTFRMGTWALCPTLVGKVDAVAVDYTDDMIVPMAEIQAVLGDRCESLGDGWYLPGLDREQDEPTLEALRARAVAFEEVPCSSDEEELPTFPAADEAPLTPEEEEELAEILEGITAITCEFLDNMMQGKGPERVIRRLAKEGIPQEQLEAIAHCVAHVLSGTVEEGRDMGELLGELAEQGADPLLLQGVAMGIDGFMTAVEEQQRRDQRKKKAPRRRGRRRRR